VAKQLAVVPDLESELDRLFELPPGEFTTARNDLARRLKQAGQNAISARVRELRKPTVPVWAVNQLARRNPKDLEALLEAVERLRSAQEDALGGGDAQELRSATSAERDALRGLTHIAHELLADEGHKPTAAVLERIASILRAAALDPDGRELLAAGRLTEELESAGFGAFAGMKLPAGSPPKRKPAPKRKQEPERTGAAVERRRRTERLRKLRDRARKLAAEAAEASRQADRAETAAERARRKADRARTSAEEARGELEAAESED
jgi:hypothetical protein